jgi:hypothetical protein
VSCLVIRGLNTFISKTVEYNDIEEFSCPCDRRINYF